MVGRIAADVVDGEVLFTEGDDAVAVGIGLGCGLGSLGRSEEEVPWGTLAELVDEDAEAPRGVTEAASGLGTGVPLDEESRRGLVLPVGGVGGFEEDPGEVSSFLGLLVNVVPKCQIGVVPSRPKSRSGENRGEMDESRW